MTGCSNGSCSANGVALQDDESQAWVFRACRCEEQASKGERPHKAGEEGISSNGSKERDKQSDEVDATATTQKKEECQIQKDLMEPIAIIGFSLRFPQTATSSQGFWDMLYHSKSAMTEIPKDRFNVDAFYHPDNSRISSINFRGGHFVKNLAAFDAPFFSITPAEAANMDPQQRGLLEITYRAFENAGITLQAASGSKTTVHVGCFTREYDHLSYRDPELQPKYQASGSGFALLANRLSWYYNLTGSSMVIDTACSSSLNALHLGCESLRRGESEMGVIAGCNLIINPDTSTPLTNLNFLSPDSRCHSFDHRANGYARGEGIGVAIIKRLSDALRDGDTIRAVVRASGANQDGRTPGITQPSQLAQEDLIRSTYSAGGLDFRTTRYFEAHGTGTAIVSENPAPEESSDLKIDAPKGDPLEAGAIGAVFGPERSADSPVIVGAVKSNIGHLEGASGIAGVLKTILVLEKGVIPPNIGFERPNPKILVHEWNIEFPTVPTAWPNSGLRRASVNSFGYGGANCHVVLDDAYNYLKLRALSGKHNTVVSPPSGKGSNQDGKALEDDWQKAQPQTPSATAFNNGAPYGHLDLASAGLVEIEPLEQTVGSRETRQCLQSQILVWSASDESGLQRLATAYSQHDFGAHQSDDPKYFASIAYTLACRRERLPWKSYLIAGSVNDMRRKLVGELSKPVRSAETPRLGYIFSGQGSAWHAMGRGLLDYSVFKKSLLTSEHYLHSLGSSLAIVDVLQSEQGYTHLESALVSQALSTVTQLALIDLLRSWGIYPSIVVGHSSGEIAAAYCNGAVSKESALRIAYYRGALADKLTEGRQRQGAMLAVALSEAEVEPYYKRLGCEAERRDISIGCINSPKNVTLTGGIESVEAVEAIMREEKIFARRLNVNVAYHSEYMRDIVAEYMGLLSDLTPGITSEFDSEAATMISTVSANDVDHQQLRRSEYWINNLVSPVRFSEALVEVCTRSFRRKNSQNRGESVKLLIEIGPHSAMRSSVRDVLEKLGKSSKIRYSSMLDRRSSAVETAMDMAGELYCHGHQAAINMINTFGVDKSTPTSLVDLPEYPFDHSQEYWQESRLSSNFRFRKHPRHELLGTTVSDWNELEGKWRNFLRVSENPWIKDHKVNGSQLYPAAGMLVMAIEAARQLADKTRKLRGYRVKETTFHKAMIVPSDEDGLETNFFLRPQKSANIQQYEWSNFRLCSYANGEWVDNCSGVVGLEYDGANDEVDNGREAREDSALCRKSFKALVDRCQRRVKPETLYGILQHSGYEFGPTFQVLHEILCNDDNEATAVLDPMHWRIDLPNLHVQDHVIHPTCLDGVLQTTSVVLTKGGRRRIPTIYPTRIENLWISAELCSDPKTRMLRVSGKSVIQRLREVETSITAMDILDEKSQIVIDGFQATALENLNIVSTNGSEQRRLCFNIEWRPDLEMMENEQIALYCKTATKSDSQDEALSQRNQDLEVACILIMAKTLATVLPEEMVKSTPHMQKYYHWMQRGLNWDGKKEALNGHHEWKRLIQDPASTESLFHRVENLDPVGKLIVAVGRQHVAIIRDQASVMELLFSTDLATNFYRHIAEQDPNYRKLAVYLDAIVHKNPGLKVLEIGAGTGGTTGPTLDALSRQGEASSSSARFSRYTFTDVSPGFFEKAKVRFAEYGERMDFRVLDIGTDPLQQGFEVDTYDLIIAANVLHATSNLDVTLQNTRKLLKPGGKIILFEVCNLSILRVPFPFGMLPGWWLSSEKHRQDSPLMREEGWHETLAKNGFSGTDIVFRDHEDPLDHTVSMIISTALEKTPLTTRLPKIIIVAATQSPTQTQVADVLRAHCISSIIPSECVIVDVGDVGRTDFEHSLCLFLPELQRPYLLGLDSYKLLLLQKIVASVDGILWVTQAGTGTVKPDFALVEGLSRTVRSENRHLRFVTLAVQNPQEMRKTASVILKVVSSMTSQFGQEIRESEYLENNGLLQISRAVEDHHMNEVVFTATGSLMPQLQSLGHRPDRPLKLEIAVPGILDTLRFVDDPIPKEDLLAHEVEIRLSACGVNFSDVLIALGQVAGDFLGTECSGVVQRVGKSVTNVTPGTRVCCFAYGAYRSCVRVTAELLAKIPDDLSLTKAAGVPTVYCTAYHALFNIAKMAKEETILVHSAAGGVGQAAIQLAKIIGAEVYATVGTNEKKALIMELYDIPEDHIFSSRNNSFSQGVRRMTQNKGVDVILNSIAGWGLRESWDCIAKFGRFVEIGKSDIYSHASLPMWPFSKCATFASGDLTIMANEKPSLLGDILRAVINLLKEGNITGALPQHVYRSSNLLEAFRYLQSGRNTGKSIIELHDDDLVPVVPDLRPRYTFDANASYVITGSSGGLGRSIVRWMVGRGARHLILLSRSGMISEDAVTLMTELRDHNIRAVALKCDVSRAEALSAALKGCASMPPIKGCIQGSLVLNDAIFENLSLPDFNAALAPKVHGSYNLHTQLPTGMDFFILLSSVAGITGNRGQSNYASGNTYQDALARHRNSIGEKAISIDLSVVGSVGFVAERLGTEAAIQTSPEYMTIQENEFHAVLDHYCNPALATLSPSQSQLVMGIHTPAELASTNHPEPAWAQTPLFRHLAFMDQDMLQSSSSQATSQATISIASLLRNATSQDAMEEIVCQALVQRLSQSLSIPSADIDVNKPMHRFGIDSLVAVEIRHWFGKEMGAQVSVIDVLESRSVAALSALVAARSDFR